ncbi:MAG: high-potential iron-sulfur protein, partial [Halomonas sp.]|nr:high-potential iron-sulfur protein [Halomonas sp.]
IVQCLGLDYVTDAQQASSHPAYSKGEHCANCMFFKEANNGCLLFPQHSVNSQGWCQSWTKQP